MELVCDAVAWLDDHFQCETCDEMLVTVSYIYLQQYERQGESPSRTPSSLTEDKLKLMATQDAL